MPGRAVVNQGTNFDTTGAWEIRIRDSRLWMDSNNSKQGTASGNAKVSKGVWQHGAIVFNRGNISFYLTGELDTSQKVSFRRFKTFDDGIKIGEREYSNADNDFKGAIDDILIYSRALKADEISSLFNGRGFFSSVEND